MSLFKRNKHRHGPWVNVKAEYIPPDLLLKEVSGYGREQMEWIDKLVHGHTIITQRCECGEYRQRDLLGKHEA